MDVVKASFNSTKAVSWGLTGINFGLRIANLRMFQLDDGSHPCEKLASPRVWKWITIGVAGSLAACLLVDLKQGKSLCCENFGHHGLVLILNLMSMKFKRDRVNIIGGETYIKNCDTKDRWSLDVSERQAEKLAAAVKKDQINLRCVQGKFVDGEWIGDNLGRIAEGLSKGRIQLQQSESKKPLTERKWTKISMKEAKGWKEVSVVYVYWGDKPSAQLAKQAQTYPSCRLFDTAQIYLGQHIGVTNDLRVVIGDYQKEVAEYLKGSSEVKVYSPTAPR